MAKDIKERPDLKRSNARRSNDNQENSHTKTIEPDGDEAESWVDRYSEILYRFALMRVKDPVIAEDLVQETFLAALRGRENFQGRSSLKSWLVAILKHKIVDHIRKNVKEKRNRINISNSLINVATCHHRIGYFNKSGNICSLAVIDVVTLGAVLDTYIKTQP